MDEEKGYRWENAYEKTWETLEDDAETTFESSVSKMIHAAKRKRLLDRKSNIRLGIMRHIYIIIDLSQSMNEKDLPPTRQVCLLRLLEVFIDEFFDQNPISQLGILITRDKRAEKSLELSGNARKLREVLSSLQNVPCVAEPSLQNALDLAYKTLKDLPSHTSREILLIFSSLSTCDPDNIYDTIELLKRSKVRCSVIGLSAETHICKLLSQETGGSYNVAFDQIHLKDLLTAQTVPPPVKNLDSKLLRMGFPEHKLSPENEITVCACHSEITKSGYFCPQCKGKYCNLPVECKICGLTLVLAPHLARSYHHLFPMRPFLEKEIDNQKNCHACMKSIQHKAYICEKCSKAFCIDCELFIHESVHLCPGCV